MKPLGVRPTSFRSPIFCPRASPATRVWKPRHFIRTMACLYFSGFLTNMLGVCRPSTRHRFVRTAAWNFLSNPRRGAAISILKSMPVAHCYCTIVFPVPPNPEQNRTRAPRRKDLPSIPCRGSLAIRLQFTTPCRRLWIRKLWRIRNGASNILFLLRYSNSMSAHSARSPVRLGVPIFTNAPTRLPIRIG